MNNPYGNVYGGVNGAEDPGRTTGYITCYDSSGQPAAGVEISVQLLETSDHAAALSYEDSVVTVTSVVGGLAQVPGMLRLTKYRAKRGAEGGWTKPFKTDDAARTPLPEVLGH